MSSIKLLSDNYDRRARLYPSLIVLLPLGFAASAWFSLDMKLWGGFISLIGTLGFSSLLAHLARDAGVRKQKELFSMWGGAPTTQMLSLRKSLLNPHTLSRYHQSLRSLIQGLRIPTSRKEELSDTNAADRVYESCTDYLRHETRDKFKFPLLFEELVNYGFRRNLWAMKPYGLLFSLVGLVASMTRLSMEWKYGWEALSVPAIISGFFCLCMTILWLFRFKPSWVRTPAEAYARELLASSEILARKAEQE